MRRMLILLFLLAPLVASAQKGKQYEDVILLKTAKVFRGTITDSIPGVSVEMILWNDSTVVFPRNEIHLITREIRRITPTEAKTNQMMRDSSYGDRVYYQGIFEAGYANSFDEYSANVFRVTFYNGIGISKQGFFGIGTGFRFVPEFDEFTLPVFAEIKASILSTKYSPFLALGVGLCFQPGYLNHAIPRESYFHIEGGFSVRKMGKTALFITAGVEQFGFRFRSDERQSFWGGYNTQMVKARVIVLSAGVAF